MTTTTETIGQTLVSMAPQITAAALQNSNPGTAAIINLAPIALQFLQTSMQLHAAGVMTDEQLASQFAIVGQGIQSTHDKWVAMNAADAEKKETPSMLKNQAG